MGEAGVDGDRVLQRPRRDAHLADRAVGIDAAAVLQIHGMLVRLAMALGRKRPVLALVRERVVRPRRLDDGHALLEQLPVHRVLGGLPVPRARRLHAGNGGVVLEPARLVAAHERDVEAAVEQVIEGGGVLGHAQRIVGGQHVAELVDAQPRPVLAEEHRHEPGVLPQLEPLDLQVVLGDADARPARGVAGPRVLGDLVEHALVQHGILARHAALQLVAPADGDVHERVEIHHGPPSFFESSPAVADSSRASRSTPISLTCSVSPTATTTWLTRSEPAPTGAAMTVTPLM